MTRAARRAFARAIGNDRADEVWMQAYVAGDLRALDVLFDRYASRFLGLFRHCLPEPAAAEELLEATFAEAHRVRHTYRAPAAARPWLFGVATRLCLDAMRRCEGRTPSAPQHPAPRVNQERVRAALMSLDGPARMVLYLHRYEAMSFAEIADILGSSTQAVRAQAFETYSSLLEQLRPWIESRGGIP